MALLDRGDRQVVGELSRLGRSLGQIVGLLDQLVKQGIAVIAIKENLRIEGQQDMQTKVMTTLFALFAEIERDLISECTKEGLPRARAAGKAGTTERILWPLTSRWQGGGHPEIPQTGNLQKCHCQDYRRLPTHSLPLHPDPRAENQSLRCIFTLFSAKP